MLESNAISFIRDYPSDGRVKVTIQETSTEIQPVYDGYPSRQHGSLNRSEVQRSYSNGHTASNATKELDDLMASLSEFKVRINHEICHFYILFIVFTAILNYLSIKNIVIMKLLNYWVSQ